MLKSCLQKKEMRVTLWLQKEVIGRRDDILKVYHGTILSYAMDICNNGINLEKGKSYLDFGKGFYTTPDIEMAKNVARRANSIEMQKRGIANAFPVIVEFEYEENSDLQYKKFEKNDMEWAEYIVQNRVTPHVVKALGLSCENKKYDIVIGGTADGNIAKIASDLRYGKIEPKDYKIKISDMLKLDGNAYSTQIVFCTEKALTCIKYIRCDMI